MALQYDLDIMTKWAHEYSTFVHPIEYACTKLEMVHWQAARFIISNYISQYEYTVIYVTV